MILKLTECEVARILEALETYSQARDMQFQDAGGHDEEARTDRDSADWVWQKVSGQRDLQFNNSVADAVGEGDSNSKVDPFDFRGLEF
tara:strand:- start:285 stop:548 length:264 start_codon:yes stop_codon:yes gene_type:complete